MVLPSSTDQTKGLIFDEERLKDPLNDRVISADKVPLPPQLPLNLRRVYNGDNEECNVPVVAEYLFN